MNDEHKELKVIRETTDVELGAMWMGLNTSIKGGDLEGAELEDQKRKMGLVERQIESRVQGVQVSDAAVQKAFGTVLVAVYALDLTAQRRFWLELGKASPLLAGDEKALFLVRRFSMTWREGGP